MFTQKYAVPITMSALISQSGVKRSISVSLWLGLQLQTTLEPPLQCCPQCGWLETGTALLCVFLYQSSAHSALVDGANWSGEDTEGWCGWTDGKTICRHWASVLRALWFCTCAYNTECLSNLGYVGKNVEICKYVHVDVCLFGLRPLNNFLILGFGCFFYMR